MKTITKLIFCILLFTSISVNGAKPNLNQLQQVIEKLDFVFGPEFTFTNDLLTSIKDSMGHYDLERASYVNFMNNLKAHLKGAKIELLRKAKTRELDIHFPHEVTFEKKHKEGDKMVDKVLKLTISTDPRVIEIQASPLSLSDWELFKPELDHFFEVSIKGGFLPNAFEGGGHINFSSPFLWKPHFFRNVLVDYQKHLELASGIYEHDNDGAAPVYAQTKSDIAQYEFIIQENDQNLARLKNADTNAPTPKQVNFTETFAAKYDGLFNGKKQAAFSAYYLDKKKHKKLARVEIRAQRAQANISEFLSQIKLWSYRLARIYEYTYGNDKSPRLLPLVDPRNSDFSDLKFSQKVARYRLYVEESGLNWKDYVQGIKKYVGDPQNKQVEKCLLKYSLEALKIAL